jgi:membrane protease YdiL (CAAX protease family)
MKKVIQSHPVASFLALTFLYSWTLWLLMILSNKNLLPFKFPTNFLGSFGPAVGALVVAGIGQGRTGLKKILKSLITWKTSAWSYVFAIFFIVLVYALTAGITYFINPELVKFGKLPGLSESVIYFFVIAIVGGPLGEEIGWRGFLQPHFLQRFSPAVASLFIASIWLIWHLPLFWLEGAAQSGGSIIYFGLLVLSMSFLFTLLYLRSKGSLLLAILFHTMINWVSAFIIPIILPASETDKTFGHVSTFLLLGSAFLAFLICRRTYTARGYANQ